MAATLNKNNSAVKRIMQEARELANDPCTDYSAAPLEDDIFEWHCTLRGPVGTEFEGGLYHFRLLLPAEYPFRPPSIMMLTPSGRFELNTKICISFTSYHEELWQPAWGVRTAILGLQGFFPLRGQAAVGVGSLEYPISERKRLAALSREWVCPRCEQCNLECLPDPSSELLATPDPLATSPQQAGRDPEPAPLPASDAVTPAAASSQAATPSSAHSIMADEIRVQTIKAITSSAPHSLSRPAPFVGQTTQLEAAVNTLADHTEAFVEPAGTNRDMMTKPPLLLDTAICVLVALVCALLCRRIL